MTDENLNQQSPNQTAAIGGTQPPQTAPDAAGLPETPSQIIDVQHPDTPREAANDAGSNVQRSADSEDNVGADTDGSPGSLASGGQSDSQLVGTRSFALGQGQITSPDVSHVRVLTKVHCALLRWEHAFQQGKHPDKDEITYVREHVEAHLDSI